MPRLELYLSDKDRERLENIMQWYDGNGVDVRSPRGELSLAATVRQLAVEKEREINRLKGEKEAE